MPRRLSAHDANLANLPDLLGDRFGRDIFMYSISLQPEHDTPERLADYASLYGVGPGWLLLTGKATDIELLRHRLGFVDSDPAQDADPNSIWARCASPTTDASLD